MESKSRTPINLSHVGLGGRVHRLPNHVSQMVLPTVQNRPTDSPTTIRRRFCLSSRLPRNRIIHRERRAPPVWGLASPTWLALIRLSSSTSVLRVDCVRRVKVLDLVQFGGTGQNHSRWYGEICGGPRLGWCFAWAVSWILWMSSWGK